MSESPHWMAVRRSRRRLVFGCAAVWIFLLGGLTWWSANPVTLNRDQILLAGSSGAIVVAQVIDARLGRVKVEEVLAVAPGLSVNVQPGRELRTSSSLTESGVKNGERIVLPLVRNPGDDDLSIAPAPLADGRAYPATAEIVAGVKTLLTTR